ncbi:double-strand break repair helicase AddA [Paracoccus shanxieyensis]|uniref:DNA 3'-5' helicase n=1 Tax=Paracoccus shanxieyensis TaxID=2675752 RepID=A0A6L6IZ86_9RHOB|nr:double-strand break repair helicase AddA [Paracoccus shanxieyensis]MTH65229.1 double-strand break repair helicase AddA [Paracoccus shanxieyensis]MTH88467.1 double-strand break repair helicase AddA [Paracoccus shanxieyensis]
MDEATLAQVRAADPVRSTWLTANAGSGKTRVLTDRVARLLLAGTAPEKILCLTYTKAAATEMQNRLLQRLGKWAMLPEPDLRDELARLGEGSAPDLPAARRLFARAIEAPGGLKVQTIHSFCAGVLRRFPIEAGVPHGFTELDDRRAALIRAQIIEDMARDDHPALQDLLTLHSGENLDAFLAGLRGFDAPADRDAVLAICGLHPGETLPDLLARTFAEGLAVIPAMIPHLLKSGTNDQKAAAKLATGNWTAPGVAELAILEGVLLTGAGAKDPFTAKYDSFPAKALRTGPCAEMLEDLAALMAAVESARPRRIALAHADRTLALHRFGHAFLGLYRAQKSAGGFLDFDDLIDRTARLLSENSMAQWVLFRLDGGIDHILVDEAQDTSPAQWQVIQRLTDEFTSGDGARGGRSLFVVGDPKQSIYSFQGADIAVFEERRAGFAAAFDAVQNPMQVLELRHSFRSSTAILSLVDQVFAGDAAQGLGDPPQHRAFRTTMPGRVDLWPVVPKPDKPEPGDWTDPIDQPAENSETTQLARAIARGIRDMLGTPIFDAKRGAVRRVRAGDVLILVQRRSDLFAEIIAALKADNLPVAGADRLKLAGELAVRDIRAVLSVLATPEDDLSLAAALRSPLFGLTEAQLYRLASGRTGEYLWRRLRESGYRHAVELLSDLMGQTGFMRPYDLIQRLLIRHNGRENLLARLGPEAVDGIDELLSQALSYESGETPSLTGFLVWLAGDDVEVRRQPGTATDEGEGLIRVMTVHGSKGLESPIVIMPDAAKRRPPREGAVLAGPDGVALWRGRKGERPDLVEDLAAYQTQRQLQERKRLLYVGLTRAESWLIVAAAGETDPDSWHGMVEAGFGRSDLVETRLPASGGGEIRRLDFGDWPADAPQALVMKPKAVDMPDWIHHPPPPAPEKRRPVAATGLGGAKVMAGAGEGDAQAAMLFGTRLHLLMEHLPGRDPDQWPDIARDVLSGAEGGLPEAAALAGLLDEARQILTAPALAEVFDLPDGAQVMQEIALTAPIPGVGMLWGKIDRLVIQGDRVLAVDYKSNRDVPDAPQATPLGVLRQMAAYRAALAQIFPGHRIEAAILWTATRSLMPLPAALMDDTMAGLDPTGPRA